MTAAQWVEKQPQRDETEQKKRDAEEKNRRWAASVMVDNLMESLDGGKRDPWEKFQEINLGIGSRDVIDYVQDELTKLGFVSRIAPCNEMWTIYVTRP